MLLAHDRGRLQALLDALAAFCAATLLQVNISKTEVVFFHTQWLTGPNRVIKYNGERLTTSLSFVYLGIVFHAKGSKDSLNLPSSDD